MESIARKCIDQIPPPSKNAAITITALRLDSGSVRILFINAKPVMAATIDTTIAAKARLVLCVYVITVSYKSNMIMLLTTIYILRISALQASNFYKVRINNS